MWCYNVKQLTLRSYDDSRTSMLLWHTSRSEQFHVDPPIIHAKRLQFILHIRHKLSWSANKVLRLRIVQEKLFILVQFVQVHSALMVVVLALHIIFRNIPNKDDRIDVGMRPG